MQPQKVLLMLTKATLLLMHSWCCSGACSSKVVGVHVSGSRGAAAISMHRNAHSVFVEAITCR